MQVNVPPKALDSVNNPRTSAFEPECPHCRGRGWVVEADGGAGAARRCECRIESRQSRLLATAGIPARYHHCRIDSSHSMDRGRQPVPDEKIFQTFHHNQDVQSFLQKARKASRDYVDGFFNPGTRRFRESGLLFFGPPGTGKTHLAAAILHEIIVTYGVVGRFIDFTTLMQRIQDTFDSDSVLSKEQVISPIIKCELLVLDELGARQPTDFARDVLYYVVNTRYINKLPTIFTTNYHLENPQNNQAEYVPPGSDRDVVNSSRNGVGRVDKTTLLSWRISAMLVSRLYEMATPIPLPERDFRQETALKHRPERY